jgi:7,8-dihydropterin-6-yl-methyl-4-(beta-D-ribofuranosyl)aminobenzene 5'-phosphate synthase
MERLGCDPKQIEAVVLSHGHWDHVTGLDGLSRALRGSQKLPLILHPDAFTKRRISVRGITPFELPTLSKVVLREAGFELIEERAPSTLFDSPVLITGEIDRTYPFETGMSSPHEAW